MAFEWNTLHGALEALFPDGSVEGSRSYEKCPLWSTTIFGAAAYLLERGGVYHRLIPETQPGADLVGGGNGPPFDWQPPNLIVPRELVEKNQAIGVQWYQAALDIKAAANTGDQAIPSAAISKLDQVRAEIGAIWGELVSHYKLPVVERPAPTAPLAWWMPALKLLIISDEASRDFGFASQTGRSHPFEELLRVAYDPRVYFLAAPGHVVYRGQPPIFAPRLNAHLARVVPKSRTPAVGCTMRTLSHNLALVPPEGIVDLFWYRELRPFPEDREPLNVLLVPFPYRIAAKAFRALSQNNRDHLGEHPWGWFHIEQTWLASGEGEGGESAADAVAELVCDLLQSAEHDVGRVHGIVLPELALDWRCYAAIVSRIQNRRAAAASSGGLLPPLDFLVAGLSTDESDRRGNYVATTTFSLDDQNACVAATYRRSKHHRWQLTGSQIADYALGSALDPNVVWWEANEIPKREISLTVFRRGAVFSAMICEDLARSEPCHEPLRSVGPNLVFVLLMDGPQLQNRWSARYATTLADDPGSSVLTLTSLGLIERANQAGRYDPSRHVAIWKDDSGRTIQIECPKDAQALLVTLSGKLVEEGTLDGRPNSDTQAWRYRGHQPVRVSTSASRSRAFERLLSGI